MSEIFVLENASWDVALPASVQQRAMRALESGAVVALEQLAFPLKDRERSLLSPAIAGKGKNVSFDAGSGRLRGTSARDGEFMTLQSMMSRFAAASWQLVRNVLPHYCANLQQARTSFRPIEITGRRTSWRKDDTRLHVDSFPSSPVQGRRILRVFSNVNPEGKVRRWRIGEPFEDVARRYRAALRAPIPGATLLLERLGITKGRRSPYDHCMIRIHDRMKADTAYQSGVRQIDHSFAAGCTWMVFTDQVSHAAMAGQHALEQTFLLPVGSMLERERSPLATLERMLGRPLI
jgi:hypothetical protein